jgi:hypothetical protein
VYPNKFPECKRIGGCLKEMTKDWKHPVTCICEILAGYGVAQQEKQNSKDKRKHLSDVDFVNQNGRGK